MNTTFSGTIREIAIGIYDGPHATPPESVDGPIFLGIENLTAEGRVDFSKVRHISEQRFPEWTRRVVPKPGDIVFSYEATLHRYGIIPEGFRGCLGRRLALIRPDTSKVDNQFLFYYLLSPKWRGVVESNIITGATVDRVPLKNFPSFPVQIPSLDTQKRIANVLSSYDNLIENNRRRIVLLEQTARLLYKEWFVHFRFPGHEHVKIVDGVPKGWTTVTIRDITDILSGFAFQSKAYQTEGTYGIVTIKNVQQSQFIPDCSSFIDVIPNNMPPHCHIKTGDILLSLTGNIGRVCVVYGDNYLLNQRVAKLSARTDIPSSYLYWLFSEDGMQRKLENLSYGVAQQNLSPVKLAEQRVYLPSKALLEEFDNFAADILSSVSTLNLTNQRLKQARDLLLPRLMNGEIAI